MKSNNGAYASELIRDIARLYSKKVRSEAEKIGIKNAYRLLLSQLYIKDGGTQLSLAEKTGLKAPTISVTLRKMEKDGLVNRTADDKDLRKTRVYLTEKGCKTMESLYERIEKIDDGFLSGLSSDENDFFISTLQNINRRLR